MGAIIYSYGADGFWIKGKRKTNSDEPKHEPVTIPNDTPPINAPEPPQTEREDSAAAPGLNGIPYRLSPLEPLNTSGRCERWQGRRE